MNDTPNLALSEASRRMLLGDRQCTARSRSGERCKRAPCIGMTVCIFHGGGSPLSIAAAKQRLAVLVEPAIDALYRAIRSAPPCEACGRSDADRDPATIRAAQLILDRCGHGATATVEVQIDANPFADASIDDLILALQKQLERAIAVRDAERLAIDGVVVDDDEDEEPAE